MFNLNKKLVKENKELIKQNEELKKEVETYERLFRMEQDANRNLMDIMTRAGINKTIV